MRNRIDNPEGDGWSAMEPHDKFLELCAISTSGDLSEEEQKDLHAHLAECPDCRQALKEFEAAAEIGMPLLHSQLTGHGSLEQAPIPTEAAEAAPSPAMEHAETAPGQSESVEQGSTIEFSRRNGHRRKPVNWNYVW